MSVMNRQQVKLVLMRHGSDSFWSQVRDHFLKAPGTSPLVRRRRWKYLAMLALRENAGWPLDIIGEVFGHPKGHVTRCLTRVKAELRETFEWNPEFLELGDEQSGATAAPEVSGPPARCPPHGRP